MTTYHHKTMTAFMILTADQKGKVNNRKLINVKSGSARKPVQTCAVVYLWNSSRAGRRSLVSSSLIQRVPYSSNYKYKDKYKCNNTNTQIHKYTNTKI